MILTSWDMSRWKCWMNGWDQSACPGEVDQLPFFPFFYGINSSPPIVGVYMKINNCSDLSPSRCIVKRITQPFRMFNSKWLITPIYPFRSKWIFPIYSPLILNFLGHPSGRKHTILWELCHTVDGNRIHSPVELGSWNPIIYTGFHIPGGCLGFLNHQQYLWWWPVLGGNNPRN